MTEINQASLRDFFKTVFNINKKYVVLKQGNWFNPQSMLPTAEKPKTWVAYRIKTNTPRTKPILMSETIEDQIVYFYKTYMIAKIEMQFVGTRAEEYANSIIYFPCRKDVSEQLEECEGVIMLKNFEVITTDFYQDGNNDILSYLTNFSIAWTAKQIVNQDIAEGVEEIGGSYE